MGNISEMESRLIIKFEGIDYLDIRFLSSFLYWFKVYSTFLNEKSSFKEIENEINEFIRDKKVIDLQEFEQKFKFLSLLPLLLKEGILKIPPLLFKHYFFFWKKEPLIYIENIEKGSWKIYIAAAVSVSILLVAVAISYKIVEAESVKTEIEVMPKGIKVILNTKNRKK